MTGNSLYIGVDVSIWLVQTVISTAVNVTEVAEPPNLLRGNETSVYGDAGYTFRLRSVTLMEKRRAGA